jgi:hypothetical protein
MCVVHRRGETGRHTHNLRRNKLQKAVTKPLESLVRPLFTSLCRENIEYLLNWKIGEMRVGLGERSITVLML